MYVHIVLLYYRHTRDTKSGCQYGNLGQFKPFFLLFFFLFSHISLPLWPKGCQYYFESNINRLRHFLTTLYKMFMRKGRIADFYFKAFNNSKLLPLHYTDLHGRGKVRAYVAILAVGPHGSLVAGRGRAVERDLHVLGRHSLGRRKSG